MIQVGCDIEKKAADDTGTTRNIREQMIQAAQDKGSKQQIYTVRTGHEEMKDNILRIRTGHMYGER